MGRHSLPDPEDSADEPSDDHDAENQDWDDELTGQPGGGADSAAADPGAFAHPQTADSAGGYPYPGWEQSGDTVGHFGDQEADEDSADEDGYWADEQVFDESQYLEQDPYGADDRHPELGAEEYPDFGTHPDGPEPSDPKPAATPPPPLFRVAGHRGLRGWQGGHRSADGRRGVSVGVIVALVAVVVVVVGVIGWRFFGDVLSNRSQTAAARCVGGNDTVAVIADPSIADQVNDFADSYNASSGPIGDRCVSVAVKAADADAVITGFIGKWPSELGAQPGLWIPGSSVSAARLVQAAGKEAISDSRSLVTSPVLLAIRPELQQALGNQNWAALPGLQSDPNSMAGLKLPSWGSLRLALPVGGNGDATFLAGEAVAAASAPADAPPTAGIGAVRTLMATQPKLADGSLSEAMDALLKADDVAAAPVHAVITTEQQLFLRAQSLSDAKKKLSSWLPPGPVAVADYPAVLLNGSWLSQEQTTAASAFARYVHKPEQLAKLAKAGFRVDDVKPPSSPVTNFPALPAPLSVGDEGIRATLADAVAAPSMGVAATIMLDQSLSTDDGGKTRLANIVAALQNRIKTLPPTSAVGLWTFDGREGRTEVPTGPLADPVNGQPRSAALNAALDKQYSSNGGAVSFTTLRMIYEDVQAHFRADQANSILVITGGPHTDQSLDGPGLENFIRTSADPAKPIAVNVIDFGADPDRKTWEAVAQLSGGSYQNLATSTGPNLAAAVDTFLS
ncbi:substrate-binding domain-containing protein [Mycobacterium marinum]|uniref:substrate-binding domain-containing protein n=1 Tax=Mycobacterium marinum TaxID=1781 RepID=UPI000B9796A3|nr:substrate-binding domain-containing protein [Mycobacterium marinum]MDC8983665.1 substrate-binding domain-containing protein [Mycobacterium marinum]MDC9000695.1 substrate-binding domain-containing protein [Mycobacterium marinum]MDC9011150.1 substrate-binding domain-containing protein [Mycobacterium marinum]MDC9017130.1 substrate-binding domain-containing protein [Mycobacterium marinum]